MGSVGPDVGSDEPRPTRTATVLIVDDDADFRDVVRAFLDRSAPFQVAAEVSDGAEAVRVATETQPDIVLLDLLMPHMSGQQALPELLRVSPQTMTVALTGVEADSAADETLAAGAFAYLEKSVVGPRLVDELTDLYRLWERALAGETVWAPTPRADRIRR